MCMIGIVNSTCPDEGLIQFNTCHEKFNDNKK